MKTTAVFFLLGLSCCFDTTVFAFEQSDRMAVSVYSASVLYRSNQCMECGDKCTVDKEEMVRRLACFFEELDMLLTYVCQKTDKTLIEIAIELELGPEKYIVLEGIKAVRDGTTISFVRRNVEQLKGSLKKIVHQLFKRLIDMDPKLDSSISGVLKVLNFPLKTVLVVIKDVLPLVGILLNSLISGLLGGLNIDFTNAKAIGKRKLSQHEAFSHGRLIFFTLTKLNKWKSCNRCSDVERYCMEKSLLEDIILTLKIFSEDLQCSKQDLAKQLNIIVRSEVIINAMETNNVEFLWRDIRQNGRLEKLVEHFSTMLNIHLKDSGIDLGSMLGSLNVVTGNVLGAVLESFGSILGGGLQVISSVAGGLTQAASGLIGGTVEGVLGSAGGIAKSATGVVGSLTKGFLG